MRERIKSTAKTIHIPDGMKKKLEKHSAEKGISEHAYIMFALGEKIKEDELHDNSREEENRD